MDVNNKHSKNYSSNYLWKTVTIVVFYILYIIVLILRSDLWIPMFLFFIFAACITMSDISSVQGYGTKTYTVSITVLPTDIVKSEEDTVRHLYQSGRD